MSIVQSMAESRKSNYRKKNIKALLPRHPYGQPDKESAPKRAILKLKKK